MQFPNDVKQDVHKVPCRQIAALCKLLSRDLNLWLLVKDMEMAFSDWSKSNLEEQRLKHILG